MCCLFNFMQYLFGFMHKAIAAVLCCMLAYAVCCVMLFAVTAGVALGYNYSVSEFMEHKDTNVSVQLQRGIFPEKPEQSMRRSAGLGSGSLGGDIGEELEPGFANPKASLRSHIQQLDAAEGYERNLAELTSENYGYKNIINYGTENLEELKTEPNDFETTTTSTTTSATTTAKIDSDISFIKNLIGKLKGANPKDVLRIMTEQMARKSKNSTRKLPADFAKHSPSPPDENEEGLAVDQIDTEMLGLGGGTRPPDGRIFPFSDNTRLPTQGPDPNVESDFSEDSGTDWKKKLHRVVSKMKRNDPHPKTKPNNKPNTKEKFLKSLFQDPSFVPRTQSLPPIPYTALYRENTEDDALVKRKANSDEIHEKYSDWRDPSVVNIPKNSNNAQLYSSEINGFDAEDEESVSASEYEYDDDSDDGKTHHSSARVKRRIKRFTNNLLNESRIITTLRPAISQDK